MPSFRLKDQHLIQSIQQGGAAREQAVAACIKKYAGFLIKIQQKLGISEDDARDCYTDAILAMVDQIERGKFAGKSRLSTYVYRIFYNKSVDLLRKKTSNPVDYQEKVPESEEGERLFERISSQDDMRRLTQLMDRLPDGCRQILLDWGFWGYSMPEIAQRAGLSDAGKAKRRKYDCLKKLQQMITDAKMFPGAYGT